MKETELAELPDRLEYEKLVLAELDAAAGARSPEQRRRHLDRASELAAAGEAARRGEDCLAD
jgi:hypothetical protein